MTETNTLVLEILKQDNLLTMSMFEQQHLASTIRHYSKVSVFFGEIDRLCLEIISILNKAGRDDAQEIDLINNLKKNGHLLWDQLLSHQIKQKLKQVQTQNLILFIDEELIHIPWEILYDGTDFLCLKFNLGRVVRTRDSSVPLPQYRSIASIPKMLILANPTSDLKSAYLEGVFIKDQLDRRRKQINVDFKSTNIDTLYVKKNLRDYDIIHFAGHCEYDAEPKNSGWVLCDGRFSCRDIQAMSEALNLPTLVFSNACYSAKVDKDSFDADCQGKTYSLASAFLFSGVRHYIGSIRKIEDPISLKFAKEFYANLISGKSVGECVRLSRLNLIKEYGRLSLSWASYLLYGDPNFTLFKAKQIARKKKRILLSKKVLIGGISLIFIISLIIYLYMWLSTRNPSTLLLFSQSKRLFQEGRNEEVILLCNRLIQKDQSFLAVYPLLSDTYKRLGKFDEALKYCIDYAIYSEKKHNIKNLASSYIGIGWLYHNQGDYPRAHEFYNKAIKVSTENNDKLNEAAALRKLAVWYIDKEDYAQALDLLTKSSEINRERQHMYEYRYNLACDYFDIGLVFINKDEFTTAKEFYTKSQKIFEKLKLKNELSDYWFNLGEIYLFEKEYQKVLDCYRRGFRIDEAQGNIFSLASDYNMMGELYLDMGDFSKAEECFNRSVGLSKGINAKLELASAYYNLGLLYKQKGYKNKAKEYLRSAQEIYSHIDTPDYQNVKEEILSLNQ